jgi:hypothetical protein
VSFDILYPGFQRLPTRKRVVDQKFTRKAEVRGQRAEGKKY